MADPSRAHLLARALAVPSLTGYPPPAEPAGIERTDSASGKRTWAWAQARNCPSWLLGRFGGAVEAGETVEEALHREVAEEAGLVIRDPVFLTDVVDHEGGGRLVSLFDIVGDYRPGDIDLHEGAGVAIQRIADLSALKITPFVRRAIESRLRPVIADGMR